MLLTTGQSNLKPPFAAGEQAVASAPIIDDERVVHHWILYGLTNPVTDGSISQGCEITSVAATHVSGWAPGGGNSVMPDNVGLVLDYPSYSAATKHRMGLF